MALGHSAGKDGAGFELVIWDRPTGQSPPWERAHTEEAWASPFPSLSLYFVICQTGFKIEVSRSQGWEVVEQSFGPDPRVVVSNRSPGALRGPLGSGAYILGLGGLKQPVGPHPRVSDSVVCFLNKFPSDADAAGPGATLENPRRQRGSRAPVPGFESCLWLLPA